MRRCTTYMHTVVFLDATSGKLVHKHSWESVEHPDSAASAPLSR